MTMPVPVKDRLLTPAEAADRLHCRPSSVYRLVAEGRLGAFKACGLRIPESEIVRLLRKGWRAPKGAAA